MDSSAILQIQKSAHIPQVLEHLNNVETHTPVAMIPSGYEMVNIEDKQEFLSRYRLKYSTNSVNDFLAYGNAFAQEGGTCFVDSESMQAKTIFDLGTIENPLHKSHISSLTLNKTAAFQALLRIDGSRLSQKDASNFIEDWSDNIKITDKSGESMTVAQAANAIQNLTIEAARSLNSTVDDFGESMSAMEKIEAKNKEALPSLIEFNCIPYHHLADKTFRLRASVLTGGDRPSLSFRIIKLEQMEEEIAEEFKAMLVDGFKKSKLAVYMGEA